MPTNAPTVLNSFASIMLMRICSNFSSGTFSSWNRRNTTKRISAGSTSNSSIIKTRLIWSLLNKWTSWLSLTKSPNSQRYVNFSEFGPFYQSLKFLLCFRARIRPCWPNWTKLTATTITTLNPVQIYRPLSVSIISQESYSTTPEDFWIRIEILSVPILCSWFTWHPTSSCGHYSLKTFPWALKLAKKRPLCQLSSKNRSTRWCGLSVLVNHFSCVVLNRTNWNSRW